MEAKRRKKNHDITFIENLRDPVWCQKQIDTGIPPAGIEIFRALAGIEPGDWKSKP
jgi:hypothetical protein